MNKKGKFIVIDGGDGTGKTSVVEFLKQKLRNAPVLFTREPGGTLAAEAIRDVLINEWNECIFAETELMLFSAARLQHVRNIIVPTLKKKTHVISDRFSLSTIAYQLYGNERLDLVNFFEVLNEIATSKCTPDLYILLDVDTDMALLRRKEAGDMNRFDKKDIEFHKAVRTGFLERVARCQHGIVIDASKSEDEVKQGVLREVKKYLNI